MELTKEGALLLFYYKKASKKLAEIIATTPNNPYKNLRRKKLAQILAIIKELEIQNKEWAKKSIPNVYRKGISDTSNLLGKLPKEKGFKIFPFLGVNEKAISILSDEASLSFANTLFAIKKNAEKIVTEIQKKEMQDTIIRDTIMGETGFTTKAEIIASLRTKGIEVFRAYGPKRTRIFNLNDYADILVRSQTMRAYNSGIVARSLSAGRKFMKVSVVSPDIDGFDICNEWEGKIVDLLDVSGKTKLPIYHPRCRHSLVPVSFEEIKRKNPSFYAEAEKYFQETSLL
jgi:hypothetical protein